MAITISGQNNNDKIIASDGVLDSISGFNIVGVLTAASLDVTNFNVNHINVGSNIQLGNAGIITATTLIGNVTGNVNATSNLLLQVGGSEKFRVASSGQLGIGGANYGTSGQVLTSGGSGSAATWSTINSDKITEGNTEVEVVDTGSDGHFKVTTEGGERIRVGPAGQIGIAGANYGTSGQVLTSQGSGSAVTWSTVSGTTINNNANNRIITGSGTANTLEAETSLEWNGTDTLTVVHPSSYPDFKVRTSAGGGSFEMFSCGNGPFRIRSSSTSPNSNADELVIGATNGTRGLTIFGATNNIFFGDADDNDVGQIQYLHSDNSMRFTTNTTERVRIDSSGRMGLGTNSPSSYNSKAYNFVLASSGHAGMTIAGGTTSDSSIYFADGTSGAAQYAGWVQYEHDNDNLTFGVNTSERVRITNDGIVVTGRIEPTGHVKLDDDRFIYFGTGDDFIIGHQPSDSRNLFRSTDGATKMVFQGGSETMMVLQPQGQVELYYDNVSMIQTESRGAFVKKGNGSDTTFTVGSTDASGVRICLDGDSNGDAYGNDYAFLQHNTDGNFVISADNPAGNAELIFCSGNSNQRAKFDSSGNFHPVTNDTYNLGTTGLRWANLYVNDLQLCNGSKAETGGNDVDGTWGDWTLQEGENDIFMINRRNGKKFKINMTEVS